MNTSLADLQRRLARGFSQGAVPMTLNLPLDEIVRARRQVHETHGGAGISVDSPTILEAIARFRKSGNIETFRDLKHIAIGVGIVNAEGFCVLSEQVLTDALFRIADDQGQPHRRTRVFQALLSAYWSFPLHGKSTTEAALAGWQRLRAWLQSACPRIARQSDFKPPWFATLSRHRNLLDDDPCDRYGTELLQGKATSLNDARDGLAIPQDSWVFEEALLAQMRTATALGDKGFKSALPRLLNLMSAKSEMPVAERLRVKCVALLVTRYARCVDDTEDAALRDCATSTIGNPWLHRLNWDAWVRADQRPDDNAREMVNRWLRDRLVSDFFELLSAEGMNDRRRLKYWLRYAPFVDDMWFALGTSTRMRRNSQFIDFCGRAKGRLLALEGGGADNNAFIMRIGDYLAVEFGESGNAFYLYRWDALSPVLLEALQGGRALGRVNIGDLRNRHANAGTQSHMDSPAALKSWEQKLDDKLSPLLAWVPEQRPACVPALEALLRDKDVVVTDKRREGGALRIVELDRATRLSRGLHAMGFAFRAGRGWSKE